MRPMPRVRSTLAVLGLLAACRTLPSAIPLADTGVGRSEPEGALALNRVSMSARGLGNTDADEESFDEAETVSVAHDPTADAGVPEAGSTAVDGGESGGRWAGEYFGSDKQTTRLEGKPEKVDLDDKAHTRVEEPSSGVILISLVSSGNGELICSMRAKTDGNRAELEPGASCPGLYVMPPLAIQGSAKLDGDELEFDVEAHGEFPADDEPITVDVDYHFEGKRR
jgi:hypothetical protein